MANWLESWWNSDIGGTRQGPQQGTGNAGIGASGITWGQLVSAAMQGGTSAGNQGGISQMPGQLPGYRPPQQQGMINPMLISPMPGDQEQQRQTSMGDIQGYSQFLQYLMG